MADRYSDRGGRDRDDDRGGRSRDRDDDRGSRRGSERDEPSSRRRGDDDAPRRSSRDDERGGRDEGRRSSRDDDRGSSRGGRSFEYHSRSREDADKRSSMGASDFDKFMKDGVKMWKPNDGDNRIRILPPTWKNPEHFGFDLWMNYGVGADRQSYLNLDKMKGEPDPISEAYEVAHRQFQDAGGDIKGNEDLKDYVKSLKPKRRVVVYLVDRDHPKEGVQAWAMPWGVDKDIVTVSVDKATGEVLPIDHPEEGYDVEFRKSGQGMRTEYTGVSIARRSTPLGDDKWLDYAIDNPLPDQLVYFDYDTIAKAFGGGGAHKGRDDRGSSRGRDDDRGGRERDERSSRDRDDRGRDSRDRDDGRSSRDRDEPSPRRRESSADDKPTWASVHAMTGAELEDLVDQEKLDIDPAKAKDDEDLADWICEELKLKKSEPEATRRRVVDDGDDKGADKLREMRRSRGD